MRRKYKTEEEAQAAKLEHTRAWNAANREHVREYNRKRYANDDGYREDAKARARRYYHQVVKPAREAKKEIEYG